MSSKLSPGIIHKDSDETTNDLKPSFKKFKTIAPNRLESTSTQMNFWNVMNMKGQRVGMKSLLSKYKSSYFDFPILQ